MSCDDQNKKSRPNGIAPMVAYTVNLGEKQYSVAVEYSYFEEEYFQFKSNENDPTDTNGEGLIISGI